MQKNRSIRRCLLSCLLMIMLFQYQTANAQSENKNTHDNHDIMTFSVVSNQYPYSFYNKNGELSGLVVDYAKRLSQLSGVEVRYVIVDSVYEAKQSVLNHKADVFPFESGKVAESSEFAASIPYLPYQLSLITPMVADKTDDEHRANELAQAFDINGKQIIKLAIVKEQEALSNAGLSIPESFVVEFETVIDALRAMRRGEVQALLAEPVATMELAERSGINDLFVEYLFPHWRNNQARMIVRANDEHTLNALNQLLSSLDGEFKNEVFSKWLLDSPYRTEISGAFGFGNPPYMYAGSSSMGVEHSLTQLLFSDMGYQLGVASALPPSAREQALKSTPALTFVSSVVDKTDSPDRFYSDSVVELRYVAVSLAGRKITLSRTRENLSLGAVVYEKSSPSYQAAEDARKILNTSPVIDFDDLYTAFNQLRAQAVDVLLVDKRVLNWFIHNTSYIEVSELKVHKSLVITIPIYIEFRTPAIQNQFNAALKVLREDEDRYDAFLKKQEQQDLQKHVKKAEILSKIAAYFIVNDRLDEFDELLKVFDVNNEFVLVTILGELNSEPTKSWYYGKSYQLSFQSIDRSQYAKIETDALYKSKSGATKAGKITFHLDTNAIRDNYAYFPSLGRFAQFGNSVERYVQDIYVEYKLTGTILNLSKAEREWIQNNPEISLGIDPSALPYEAVDKQGRYVGIINDYVKLIESQTGLVITPSTVDSWENTMNMADHGAIELISAAVENTSLGENYMNSEPLFSSRLAIASIDLDSVLELSNKENVRIGIPRHGANTQDIVDKYDDVTWVLFNSTQEGLEQVEARKLDGYVDTVHVLNYQMNTHGYNDVKIVGRLDHSLTPTFHTLKSLPQLSSIISKAILSISTRQHRQIETKWSAPKQIERTDYTLVILISAFLLLILFIIFIWNRKLKRQVAIAKNAIAKYEASQQRLYAILNTSPIAASLVVGDTPTYINDTAKSMFSLKNIKLDEFNVNDIYIDTITRNIIYEELAREGSVVNRELEVNRADGSRFTALTSYYRFEIDGEMNVLFWAFDITEQKRLNESLALETERANAASTAKSDFLANMSHEIRTPMNAIIGMSHLAIPEITSPIAKKYIRNVHSSALSLLDIINDILDLSKIEAGQLSIELIPFRFTDTLNEVVELVEVKANEKAISLVTEFDSRLNKPLRGDSLRIFQVSLNLIGNAIKFTEQGNVTIKAEVVETLATATVVKVSVSDSGIGIEKENLSKLFDAFSQADATTTRRFGGTGLGLNISQKLIHAMQGSITVDSTFGKGSCFSYQLTLEQCTDEDLIRFHGTTKPTHNVKFNGEKVLLVEDNELNQQLASAILEKVNLTVDIAENGAVAIELTKKNKYRVILMDIQMPVMDGIEATRLIRDCGDLTPILAMSANVFDDVKKRAIQNGVNGFVDKPIIYDVFTASLSKYIAPTYVNPTISNNADDRDNEQREETSGVGAVLSKPDNLMVYNEIAARLHTQQDPVLLNKLTMSFRQSAPKYVDQAQKAIASSDTQEAARAVHTLKSMSASLGGEQLANYLQERELQMSNHRLGESLDSLDVSKLMLKIDEFLEALPHGLEPKLDTNGATYHITEQQYLQLKTAIENFDASAIQLLDAIVVNGAIQSEALRALKDSLSDYDFETALDLLDKVRIK